MTINTATSAHLFNVASYSPMGEYVDAAVQKHMRACARAGFNAATAVTRRTVGPVSTFLLGTPQAACLPPVFKLGETQTRPGPAADLTAGTASRNLLEADLGYQALKRDGTNCGAVGWALGGLNRLCCAGGALAGAMLASPWAGVQHLRGQGATATLEAGAAVGRDAAAVLAACLLLLPNQALDVSRTMVASGYAMWASLGAALGMAVGAVGGLAVAPWAALEYLAGPGGLRRVGYAIAGGLVIGGCLGTVTGVTAGILVALAGVTQAAASGGAILASALYATNLVGALVGTVAGVYAACGYYAQTPPREV